MSLSPSPKELTAEHPNTPVEANVECRRCGYNLRGLNSQGRCPECSTPVGLSIQGDLLRYSDPDWLDKLRSGGAFLYWGMGLTFVGSCLGGIGARLPGMNVYSALFSGLFVLGCSLLIVYAIWQLTSPDPGGVGDGQYSRRRNLIRIFTLVSIAAACVVLTDYLPLSSDMAMFLEIGSYLGIVCGVAGTFMLLGYLRLLALRIPDAELARRARLVQWGYTIATLAVVGLSLAPALQFQGAGGGTSPPPPSMGSALQASMIIATIVLLFFLLLLFRFIHRFRRKLKEQASMARASWAAVGAA